MPVGNSTYQGVFFSNQIDFLDMLLHSTLRFHDILCCAIHFIVINSYLQYIAAFWMGTHILLTVKRETTESYLKDRNTIYRLKKVSKHHELYVLNVIKIF